VEDKDEDLKKMDKTNGGWDNNKKKKKKKEKKKRPRSSYLERREAAGRDGGDLEKLGGS